MTATPSFLQAIIDYIQAQGIATFGTDLYGSFYPSGAPDTCLLIKQSSGPAPTKYMPIAETTIQCLSRAPYSPDAEARIMKVYELFHGKVEDEGEGGDARVRWVPRHNYKVGGGTANGAEPEPEDIQFHILNSEALQFPGDISPDEAGRAEWSVNFYFKYRLPKPPEIEPEDPDPDD